jgi:hypothetical protein
VYQTSSKIKVSLLAQRYIPVPDILSFPVGTKIAEDLQPVCVFCSKKDEVQVLNDIDEEDGYIGGDPVFQTYHVGLVGENLNSLPYSSVRVGGFIMWPLLFKQVAMNDGVYNFSSDEARGSFKNVYVCNSGSIGNEGTVTINGKTYKAFAVNNTATMYKILIGPME